MRFVWPAQRYDRLTPRAAALSAAITMVGAAALSLPIVSMYRAANGEASFRADESREVVTYLRPEARPEPVTIGRSRPGVTAAQRARPNERLLNSDTGSAAPTRLDSPGGVAGTSAAAPIDEGRARAVGPVATPVGIVRAPVVGAPPPRWKWLPPTQEELDSMAREQERRMAESRDQHRPVAMPLGGAGGVSLPLPFLSRGPSREERARDSVINADNLARLARLAERARKKRDSLNAVKALAGLAKMDSMTKPNDRRR